VKKLFLGLFLCLGYTLTGQCQTIPNNDFEDWELDTSWITGLMTLEPVDWSTTNYGDTTLLPDNVKRDTDAYSGDYSVSIAISDDYYPEEIDAEVVVDSVSSRYLNGYFKGSIDSTSDTLLVSVAYYNYLLDSFYVMGGYTNSVPADWEKFRVDVNPSISSDFDTAYVLIMLIGKSGAIVKVDSVCFESDSSGGQRMQKTAHNPYYSQTGGPVSILKNEGPLFGVNLYPNPASAVTHIDFNLIRRSQVTIEVVDCMGHKVETPVSGEWLSGNQHVAINTQDLSSGIYFVRIISGKYAVTKQLLLRK
jgi:hypothetical protein